MDEARAWFYSVIVMTLGVCLIVSFLCWNNVRIKTVMAENGFEQVTAAGQGGYAWQKAK